MTKKQTLFLGLTQLVLLAATFLVFSAPKVSAQTPPQCQGAGSADAMEACSRNAIEDECGEAPSAGTPIRQAEAYEECRRSTTSGDSDNDGISDEIEEICGTPTNDSQSQGFDACRQQVEAGTHPSQQQSTGGSNETVQSTGSLDGDCKDINDCKIIGYLRDFINLLSVVVGIVVAIMIVVGGIQYSASRDNPQATAAAKQRVTNAVIALVVYVFIFAILEYLVPGGVF